MARPERPDFDVIVAAVEAREAAQVDVDLSVARARDRGASWALIGRSAAICAADDAGVPRELIARAAGLQWPMSRQRWSQLRGG